MRRLVFFLILFSGCFLKVDADITANSTIKVYINKFNGIRVLYKDLLIMESLSNVRIYSFYLFKKLFYKGPWGKTDLEINNRKKDKISIKQGFIRIFLEIKDTYFISTFKFDSDILGVKVIEYSICKIPGFFFKGAKVKFIKENKVYETILPVIPPSMKDRLLIKDASSIEIYSPFCTLIISDETGQNSINVADFRSVPWDKKTFYIYASKKPLYPVKKYHFRYKFVIKPPQVSINEIQFSKVVFQTKKNTSIDKKIIILHPQEIEFKKGHFLINDKTSIVVLDEEYLQLANILKEEITSLFNLKLKTQKKSQIKNFKNLILLTTLDLLPQNLLKDFHFTKLKPEGYYLLAKNDQIVIIGKDKRGIFYGIQSLLQLMKKNKNKIIVPCVKIKDYPDLKIRGMCISAPFGFKDINILKNYIKALAKYKANTIILYYCPNYLFNNRKKIINQIKEISNFAKKYFIEIIPGLRAKLDPKIFENIVENKNGVRSFYCPSLEESYKVMFGFYQDLIDATKPKYFLIGHDEIKNLAKCPRCKDKKPYELLLMDIKKIHNWLAKRGIITLIWGDMFLNRKDWQSDITAHSNVGAYPSNTHKVLPFLPKDIIILDWQYNPREDYPTLKYFKDNGFKVIGISWYDEKNNYYLAQSAYKYGALGILGSDWGFLRTLSFGANSILCLEYGWSINKPELGELLYDPIKVFAKEIKPLFLIPNKESIFNIDLSPYANESTIDEKFGDSIGWFDLGPLFDLKNLPIGEQKFAGINFYIASPKNGQKNCIIVGKNTYQPLPEEIKGIKVNKKVKALFFLHTMMSPLASVWHKTIGVYKINYADGTFVDVKLIENFNITDFRSSGIFRQNPWSFNKGFEILYGSECGWEGISLSGAKINLQVYKWENPFPEKIVKSIDIKAVGEKPVKIALLGISGIDYTSSI